jgi:dipeptidase
LQKFESTNHYWNIETITDEDRLQYNGLVDELNDLEDSLNAQFLVLQQAQESFAAKHKLILDTQIEDVE